MTQSVKRQSEGPCDNDDQQNAEDCHGVDRDRLAQHTEFEEHMVLGIEDAILQRDHGRQAAEEPGNSAQGHAAPNPLPRRFRIAPTTSAPKTDASTVNRNDDTVSAPPGSGSANWLKQRYAAARGRTAYRMTKAMRARC